MPLLPLQSFNLNSSMHGQIGIGQATTGSDRKAIQARKVLQIRRVSTVPTLDTRITSKRGQEMQEKAIACLDKARL